MKPRTQELKNGNGSVVSKVCGLVERVRGLKSMAAPWHVEGGLLVGVEFRTAMTAKFCNIDHI